MRDRLMDMVNKASDEYPAIPTINGCKSTFAEYIADHLLANGIIVPPCKVGQPVYTVNRKALSGHWEDNRYIVDAWSEWKVCEIPFSLTLWECGWHGVYLTREEAEKALAERREQ